MPYTETFPLGGNGDIIQDLLRRIEVLEARSRVLVNASQLVEDLTGTLQAIIGQLPDGTYGIQAGTVKLNANGVTVEDASGTTRVLLGHLPDGDYGLQIIDGAGVSGEVLPAYNAAWLGAALSTNSTTKTTLTNSPTVDAWLGASGDADVTVSAQINPGNVNSGWVYLTLDGTLVSSNPILIGVSNTTAPTYGSYSATVRLSSFGSGPASGQTQHTFGLEYASGNGSYTVAFSTVSIVVNPI